MLHRYMAAVAGGLLLLAGCGGSEPTQTSPSVPRAQATVQNPPTLSRAPGAAPAEPPSAAANELGATGSDFGWELYGALPAGRGNLVLGVHSVRGVLAGLAWAAAGRTAEEFAYAAGLGERNRLSARWAALEASLGEPLRGGSVRSSLGAWAQSGYPFRSEFLSGHTSVSTPATVNLRDGLYDAGNGITGWLQEHAGSWVTNWMPHPSASSHVQVVVADSLRTRGSWTQPFSPVPREGAFELPDGLRIPVPVLEQTAPLRYGQGENYRAFELPTDREGLSFLVIVPDTGAFEAVEASLDSDAISEVDELLNRQFVHVVLPKLALVGSTSLSGPLARLGLGSAFDPSRADFSGLGGGTPHYLGAVDHQTAISLTEKGFEVSAASVAELDASKESLGSGRSDPGFQVVVLGPKAGREGLAAVTEAVVARPFLFVVRDVRNGATLFLGRVTDPTA